MNLNHIIDIIKENGGRYIITKDGQEEVVVMSAQEYKSLLEKKENKSVSVKPAVNRKFLDEINQKLEEIPFGEEIQHTISDDIALEEDEEPIYFEEIPEEEEMPGKAENIDIPF